MDGHEQFENVNPYGFNDDTHGDIDSYDFLNKERLDHEDVYSPTSIALRKGYPR